MGDVVRLGREPNVELPASAALDHLGDREAEHRELCLVTFPRLVRAPCGSWSMTTAVTVGQWSLMLSSARIAPRARSYRRLTWHLRANGNW